MENVSEWNGFQPACEPIQDGEQKCVAERHRQRAHQVHMYMGEPAFWGLILTEESFDMPVYLRLLAWDTSTSPNCHLPAKPTPNKLICNELPGAVDGGM